MLTQNKCDNSSHLGYSLNYYSDIQMLFSLDALERGTYQYEYDSFGTRKMEKSYYYNDYLSRPSALEFTEKVNKGGFSGNEVMVKERIPPSLIDGLVVPDKNTANSLVNYLKGKNLVQIDKNGQETVLDIPIDKFIRVGRYASDDLLA